MCKHTEQDSHKILIVHTTVCSKDLNNFNLESETFQSFCTHFRERTNFCCNHIGTFRVETYTNIVFYLNLYFECVRQMCYMFYSLLEIWDIFWQINDEVAGDKMGQKMKWPLLIESEVT